MKLEFTNHAKHRLFLEREISVDAVKTVIREPSSISYLPNGAVKCVKETNKGMLVVVYKKEKSMYVIVTAYFK